MYRLHKDTCNLVSGLFEWIEDDHIMGSYDIGPIDNGGVAIT